MKSKLSLLLIFTLLIGNTLYAQIQFEKGYFLDLKGEKTECYIKNIDWLTNPTKFSYRISPKGKTEVATIDSVKEFAVYKGNKYIRATVDIEISSNEVSEMDHSKLPNWEERTVFLKVLVEGESNLYFYEKGKIRRYFFKTPSVKLSQLVYKKYKASANRIAENKMFQNQLRNHLKCSSISISQLRKLKYFKDELVAIFHKANACNSSKAVTKSKKRRKKIKKRLNITAIGGINYSDLELYYNESIDLGDGYGFKFGGQAEYILPFNKNKWSLFVEPTYNYYKNTGSYEFSPSYGDVEVEANFKFIQIAAGFKHFMYLNKSSKLFLSPAVTIPMNLGSEITLNNPIVPINDFDDTKITIGMALGFGYVLKDKYSIELRWYTENDFLDKYIVHKTDYGQISLVFGYNFLKL